MAVAETGDAAGAGAGAGAGAAVSASAGGAAPITGLFGARPAKAGRAMKPAQLRADKGRVLLVLAGHARWLALVVFASAGGACVWVYVRAWSMTDAAPDWCTAAVWPWPFPPPCSACAIRGFFVIVVRGVVSGLAVLHTRRLARLRRESELHADVPRAEQPAEDAGHRSPGRGVVVVPRRV